MKINTGIRVSTHIDLEPSEEFDVDLRPRSAHLGLNGDGVVRVKRLRVTTNLAGVADEDASVYLTGLRYKQDGTLGKAPASDLLLWNSEFDQVPAAIYDAIQESVRLRVAADAV